MRARSRAGRPQLDMFDAAAAAPAADPAKHPVLEMVRAVDIDRLTPLEALQLLANLRKMSTES